MRGLNGIAQWKREIYYNCYTLEIFSYLI